MSDDMKTQLRNTVLGLVEAHGLINVTLADVCKFAGIPVGSFTHYTGQTFTEYMRDLQRSGHDGPPIAANKTRVDPYLVPGHVLNVAINMAKEYGYQGIQRAALADRAGVTANAVYRLYSVPLRLERDIMRRALELGLVRIVAQGLAINDSIATAAPAELKAAAAEWIASK